MAWGKLEDAFWRDRRLKALGSAARDLFAYLLTGPQRNRLGYYTLDTTTAGADLTTEGDVWTAYRVEAELERLHQAGRLDFDTSSGVVFLRRWWRHNGVENFNVSKGAAGEVRALPASPFLPHLLHAVEGRHRAHLATNPEGKDRDRWQPLLVALHARLAEEDQLALILVDNPGDGRAGAIPGVESRNGSETVGKPSPNGFDTVSNTRARGAVAVAVAVAEPENRASAEAEKLATRYSDDAQARTAPADQDEGLEPGTPASPLERLLVTYPAAAAVLAQLEHPGGSASTDATLAARFLYEDQADALGDGGVRGLPLAARLVVVAGALLEYADQGERTWSRPLFAGFCRRIRERNDRDLATNPTRIKGSPLRVFDSQGRLVDPRTGQVVLVGPEGTPPPSTAVLDDPGPSAEDREAIARMARETADALRPPVLKRGKTDAEVRQEQDRQRKLLGASLRQDQDRG